MGGRLPLRSTSLLSYCPSVHYTSKHYARLRAEGKIPQVSCAVLQMPTREGWESGQPDF